MAFKAYTIKQQFNYNAKRSKKGTLDRNGKPLTDFMRGKYLGKAEGLKTGAIIHKTYKAKAEAKRPIFRAAGKKIARKGG
jgi:hypothetical protein